MALHTSKKIAILQVWNSLSLDLVDIQQLADGKYFCNLICSVYEISPELQPVKDPGTLNIESVGEEVSEDAVKNAEVLATDLNVGDKVLNEETIPVLEVKTPENKVSENIKSETRSSKRRSCKKDLLSGLNPEIPSSTPKIPTSATDISTLATDIPTLATDIPASATDIPASATDIPATATDIPASATDIPASVNEIPSSAPDFLDITKRYRFLQKFIDDVYVIDSSKIVTYSLCMKSDELELAKVAVLILSSVVKHYLSSEKEILNTLALLDHEVQEDIKECLSLFLLPDMKVTKDEIEYILTKPAQYKKSFRSPRFTTTPRRTCLSRYKKSVSAVTPSGEDVFSDSPLKSFFESPHFQNRELLTKELAKTRKMFLSEEQRSEDLMLEVNSLKKKLEDKNKENKALKEKIRKVRSSKEETNECKSCDTTRTKLNKAKMDLKRQKEDFKEKENEQEREICKLTSMVSVLEARLKNEKRLKLEESLSPSSHSILEDKCKLITHLQIEYDILGQDMEKIKEELEEKKKECNIINSLLKEKTSEQSRFMEPVTPVAGECLGSVIEVENKQLRAKVCKLESILENLQNQKCLNSQGVAIINQELNVSAISQSDLSLPVLMDVSEISEADKDATLNNAVEIGKCKLSLSNDCNLNDAKIDNKDEPSVSNDCNLKNDVDLCKNVPNLLSDCDILTSMPNVNEKEQTCYRSLRKRKSNAVFEEKDVPVANNAIGSLWSQYNDSGSEWESSIRVSFSNNVEGLSKQDLLKQLGFSEVEYPTKVIIAKKLWALIKELFATNGSNGFVGLSLKSDEDYIMCLLPIREYLFRFQNNNSISKDCVLPDKNLCSCGNMSNVKELKKENEELRIKLSESESDSASYMQHKDAEMGELLGRLDATQQKYQELIKTYEDFCNKYKVLFRKNEGLKNQMAKMKSKISEADRTKNQYTNLLNAKNEAEHLHKKQLKLCHDKIVVLDAQTKEFQTAIEKEKKLKRSLVSQVDYLKSQVSSLKFKRQCLERDVAKLKTENERLSSCNKEMKEDLEHAAKRNRISCSFPIHQNSRSRYDKNSEININVKVQEGNSHKTSSVHDMSVTSLNYPSKFVSVDASQISASFNKSIHSFALINDDEEEYSFQGESLAEIKKEYDSSENTRNERRVTELHRRNTMYLPHMQSSYPVELQSISPFSQKLLENVEKSSEGKATEKSDVPSSSATSHDQASKKRKVEEVEPECVAGPSQLPTPVKVHKSFKTPSSLHKLLRNYRPKHRRPNAPPKSMS